MLWIQNQSWDLDLVRVMVGVVVLAFFVEGLRHGPAPPVQAHHQPRLRRGRRRWMRGQDRNRAVGGDSQGRRGLVRRVHLLGLRDRRRHQPRDQNDRLVVLSNDDRGAWRWVTNCTKRRCCFPLDSSLHSAPGPSSKFRSEAGVADDSFDWVLPS